MTKASNDKDQMDFSNLAKFKNIGLMYHNERGGYYTKLANELKKINGANIHFFCTDSFTQKKLTEEGFESVTLVPFLYSNLELEEKEIPSLIEKTKALEERFGFPFNYFFMVDRHLGRGYSLGGFRHPRSSYSESTSYFQGLKAFIREIDFWDKNVKSLSLDFFIGGSKLITNMMRTNNVVHRGISESRYKNFRYWSFNEFFESPKFEEAFNKVSKDSDLKLEDAYHLHNINRDIILKRIRLHNTIKDSVITILKRINAHLKGYQKAKGYYLFDTIKFFWKQRQDYLWLKKRSVSDLERFKGKKLVFFGLHIEPEATLQQMSPLDFSQLSTIASVSRDLPPDCIFLIKENFIGMGRRPKDFYKQILSFKNVVMLDPSMKGVQIVQKSDLVVTMTGTIGFEGAVFGKPVLSIGKHNFYNFIDHVFCVERAEDQGRLIREALSSKFDSAKAEKDGKKFLQAVIDISYDLENESVYDQHGFSDKALMKSLIKLEESFS